MAMKYIDADRFRAEIEKKYRSEIQPWLSGVSATSAIYDYVLPLIKSLQQEQPEVDLRNEINRFLSNATMMNKGEWKGKYPISEMGFGVVARHFTQWGAEHAREQMMKEAVEATLDNTAYPTRLYLSLTWEDIQTIDNIVVDMAHNTDWPLRGQEVFYTEVLNRFNKLKEKKK